MLLCLIALTTWCFTACDETINGDNGGGFISFPSDTLEVDAVPGDTVLVSFSVGYNWRVNSNKDWCLVDGAKTTTGKAGSNTVEFVVGEPENMFADDEALITLRPLQMSSESQVYLIARITCRATKEYMVEVRAEDKAYVDGESIVIGTSGELVLELAPNFNIDSLGVVLPTWLERKSIGNTMILNVKEDSLKYVINNEYDSLRLFKGNANTFLHSFHVQYAGMDPRVILVDGQLENQLIVSRDAKSAHIGEEKIGFPIAFTVTALNDEYQVLALGYDNVKGDSLLADEDKWFALTDDECGNIELSVTEENDGKDRTAILVALPKVIADSLTGAESVVNFLYQERVNGMVTFKEETQQYLLAQLTQYGPTDLTIEPEAQWGVKVSVDGKTYTNPTSASAGVSLPAPVKATISAEHGYQLVYVNYDYEKGCVIIPEADSWLNVIDDRQGNIEVNFSRNVGNMRTAYLLALPVVLAEDVKNLASELFEVAEGQENGPLEIRVDAEKYVVGQFIQDAEEESSMKVIDANFGWKYLPVENETDDKWLNIAAAKGINPKKVFKAELKNGASYLLNPLLAEDVWAPGDSQRNDRIEVYSESGHKYTQGKGENDDFDAEPTKMEEEEGDYMLVQFSTSYNMPLDEYYIIYFVTADNVYLKALVVWNYWE